eukprot:CAMPEP_0206315784 /NCGR_PEP_ID=MMETSP0106_2-20121207/15753_1 /ASSEMBLY_ACC=CAM_ASM_000206 /TAXON_ID=81532 /ORGANISM="Acanthoeca-like sp., Strain 10tr" /LENGTH=186 /DNA_ID=CAMNT_0053747265 /DNA_START=264 /DNA_END=827 /DNA_ORIENTATION=-
MTDSEDQSPGSYAECGARADSVTEILHSIEPAVQTFNLLTIAVCPGMFSPVLGVAAVGTLICLREWEVILAPPPSHQVDGAKAEMTDAGPSNPHLKRVAHKEHPMPIACIVMLLTFHSVYLFVLLQTADEYQSAGIVVTVNWLIFFLVWRHHHKLARGRHGNPKFVINRDNAELTEMLLPTSGVME